MSFDLKLTHSSLRLSRKIASTSLDITQEGLLLVRVLEDGIEKVALKAQPARDDVVIGYSVLADALPNYTTAVETLTVPAIIAGFVEVDLRNNNLVNGFVRIVDAAGAPLAIDYIYAGAPVPGTVKVDTVNGKLKFDAAQGGVTVTVTYKYELTMTQAQQIFGQRFINNWGLHASFGQLEIGAGLSDLWTDAFDASQQYDTAISPPLFLGANGIVTTVAGGPALNALIIGVPNSSNPRLGLRFSTFP